MSSDRSVEDNDDKIVEDAPRMRSVSMLSALPPAQSLIREAPALKEYVSVPQRLLFEKASQSPIPLQTTCVPSIPSAWTAPTLQLVPLYYQLERTHAKIKAEAPVVALRVTDCFRNQSMSASYHEDEACVDVETCDNVTFSVRLWRLEDDHQVIVEIQRTSGCCFLFHQCSKSLLRAAMGMSTTKSPVVFTLPKCIPQESEAERLTCLKESLGICSNLLQGERMDTHLMALESLVKLSDCCRSRKFAARCILESTDFLHTLVSLIQSSSLAKEDDINRSDCEREHMALMHRHAMTVLANCLAALQEDGNGVLNANAQTEVFLSDTTLMALIDQVAHCDKQPHDACQAIRCLQELVCLKNSDCKQRVLALGLASHADFARQLGDRRHVQLHTESQKLLNQLKD